MEAAMILCLYLNFPIKGSSRKTLAYVSPIGYRSKLLGLMLTLHFRILQFDHNAEFCLKICEIVLLPCGSKKIKTFVSLSGYKKVVRSNSRYFWVLRQQNKPQRWVTVSPFPQTVTCSLTHSWRKREVGWNSSRLVCYYLNKYTWIQIFDTSVLEFFYSFDFWYPEPV